MPKLKIIWRQAQARKTAAAGAGRLRRAASALLPRVPRLPTRELTSKNVGTGLVGASACGDGKIVDARFKTSGCGSAIASSSLASEWIKGKTVEEALTIKNTDLPEEPCLPPVTPHCSMLAEEAIQAALADYRLKTEPETEEAEKK
ncbi:hypothetical protein FD755_013851 [Muntiacus reevesi]|uniref:NIF system FeS cluster assembly NifU N-terminal domain-containing protein n=1 Tax=Muntiacus reevesi TaxID=9886 RepID=A0A5N3XNF8_MUNRE|nr:hypothetical protein FD755_013851 [Muntiacus reevesi]